MAEITYFISQILPNPRVREFVMTVLSSFLSGNTNEEHFHIWTGSGGNGKSKLIELFELAIGDYSAKLPVSLLTGKRGQSSAASPEVAMLKGKRFVCLQEPSEGAKIDGGLMKEMTGGDKMYARALYANPIEFKPQFKIVLACNDPPELPKDDGGVWRRVKMVNFPSKFKPRDDLTAEDGTWDGSKWIPKNPDTPVYPMDETIDQKFEEWREVFLYMLLEQYKHYRDNDLVIPPEVKATTSEYQQSQFKLSTFFKEVIQIDMDFVAQVSVTEIYDYYKDWFQDTQGGNKKEMLKRQDLTQYLESYYGDHRVEGSANMYTHIKFADERMGGSVDIGSRVSFRDEGLDDES
jgi:phage/plasmid-associated DNA primase